MAGRSLQSAFKGTIYKTRKEIAHEEKNYEGIKKGIINVIVADDNAESSHVRTANRPRKSRGRAEDACGVGFL